MCLKHFLAIFYFSVFTHNFAWTHMRSLPPFFILRFIVLHFSSVFLVSLHVLSHSHSFLFSYQFRLPCCTYNQGKTVACVACDICDGYLLLSFCIYVSALHNSFSIGSIVFVVLAEISSWFSQLGSWFSVVSILISFQCPFASQFLLYLLLRIRPLFFPQMHRGIILFPHDV
jgi:hypothetical protein